MYYESIRFLCVPTRSRGKSRIARGFTLVEIMIVVAVLGILAAIVVPMYQNHTSKAEAAALQTNLNAMKQKITSLQSENGEWPTAIDGAWFSGGAVPGHPQNKVGAPAVQAVDGSTLAHPIQKVLTPGSGGAYWYNYAAGVIRARVADQGSEAATLAFYNEVNQCQETALGNYGGGAGAS